MSNTTWALLLFLTWQVCPAIVVRASLLVLKTGPLIIVYSLLGIELVWGTGQRDRLQPLILVIVAIWEVLCLLLH